MEEKFIISKVVKAATKDCSHDFSCLSGSGMCMGKVVFCVNCKIHGIVCGNEDACSYRYEAEERTFCTCPTRKEIYAKYKV